jgi:Xaa-Pro aminopeptidase
MAAATAAGWSTTSTRRVAALAALDVGVFSAQEVMEHARTVKCADELMAMRRAVAACEAAMGVMERRSDPA